MAVECMQSTCASPSRRQTIISFCTTLPEHVHDCTIVPLQSVGDGSLAVVCSSQRCAISIVWEAQGVNESPIWSYRITYWLASCYEPIAVTSPHWQERARRSVVVLHILNICNYSRAFSSFPPLHSNGFNSPFPPILICTVWSYQVSRLYSYST